MFFFHVMFLIMLEKLTLGVYLRYSRLCPPQYWHAGTTGCGCIIGNDSVIGVGCRERSICQGREYDASGWAPTSQVQCLPPCPPCLQASVVPITMMMPNKAKVQNSFPSITSMNRMSMSFFTSDCFFQLTLIPNYSDTNCTGPDRFYTENRRTVRHTLFPCFVIIIIFLCCCNISIAEVCNSARLIGIATSASSQSCSVRVSKTHFTLYINREDVAIVFNKMRR